MENKISLKEKIQAIKERNEAIKVNAYQDLIVESATLIKNKDYDINTKEGSIFIMTSDVEPKAGDVVRLYTYQGSRIKGYDLNGEHIDFKTMDMLEEEHRQWCDNLRKKREKEFEKNKKQMDKDFDSLPDAFKKRISRFRSASKDFRIEEEGYEMFVCKEAVKIVNYFKTLKKIEPFCEESASDKRHEIGFKKIGMDEGHSGNTFGGAWNLAYWYLKDLSKI